MHEHAVSSLADTPWPEGGLVRVTNCPVCNNDQRDLMYEGLSDTVFFCAPGRWTLYRCTACRSGYLDPRPSEETLGLAYSNYYTHGQFDPQADQPTNPEQFAGSFRQSLRNGYENFRYGTKKEPAASLGALVGFCWPRMSQVIDYLNYYITNRPHRLLEIGFGGGRFLSRAHINGWNPIGVDLDPVAIAQAREAGLEVYEGGIEIMIEKDIRFDAIALSHSIEHVPDPVGVLKTAFSLLNPGGMIYLDTPNLEASGHNEFRNNWRGLEPPRHLVIFTWESMERLLREIGFVKFKRHPRPQVTQMIWNASSRIKRGVPYDSHELDQVTVPLSRRLAPYISRSSQEFLTLTATKP